MGDGIPILQEIRSGCFTGSTGFWETFWEEAPSIEISIRLIDQTWPGGGLITERTENTEPAGR